MSDLLQSYFTELRNIKPAKKEDIDKFWKKAKKGDKKAFKRLVELNYCLVIPIAKRFSKKGVDFMDLIADGNIGLMKAVEKFDPSKDIKFSTYATYWIEQYIRKCIEDNSKTIRVPSYMYDIINKWKKSRNSLVSKLNREPTLKEVAKKASVTQKEAAEVLNALVETVQATVAKGNKVTLVGFGTFEPRQRAARNGRNPQTGKEIKIPAKVVPAFSAGKKFKTVVNAQ